MSVPPELPAPRHLDAALDPEASPQSPQESEHPVMFALACACVIIALAADLLTAVVFTVAVGELFPLPRCIENCAQPSLTGITIFLRVAAAAAVTGAAGSLITSILVRRRATQRPETADEARIATVGVRLSALAVAAWGMALCGYLFLTVK